MFECNFDARVKYIKRLTDQSPERVMVACQIIGLTTKGSDGEWSGLTIFVNVFFPASFRGVLELRKNEIVRINARVTTMDQLPDNRGKNTTIIRMSMHGYSLVKQILAQRSHAEEELMGVR